jgi:hypothetical protein
MRHELKPRWRDRQAADLANTIPALLLGAESALYGRQLVFQSPDDGQCFLALIYVGGRIDGILTTVHDALFHPVLHVPTEPLELRQSPFLVLLQFGFALDFFCHGFQHLLQLELDQGKDLVAL